MARTHHVSFGGSEFTPQTFAGNVNFNPVPEPATVLGTGAAGLGLIGWVRRRRAAV
ncbi:MAG: PEP-CTERM sorting domain-containing protein [Fimbriiglobus sp.]